MPRPSQSLFNYCALVGRVFLTAPVFPPPPPPLFLHKKTSNRSDSPGPRRHTTRVMAADRAEAALEEPGGTHSSDRDFSPDDGRHIPKRHARVTVKYNRKELQKRLDVEKWIDESLDQLYSGQVGPTPVRSPPLNACFRETRTFFFVSFLLKQN